LNQARVSTLLQAPQRVVVGLDASRLSSSKKLHDPAQRLRPCELAHSVWTDKDAVIVERERRDVCIKLQGLPVHKQILFHVGNIESTNDSVVLVQILPNRLQGFRSSEVTSDRNDQILFLKSFDELVVVIRRKKTLRLPALIERPARQVFERSAVSAAPAAVAAVCRDSGAVLDKSAQN